MSKLAVCLGSAGILLAASAHGQIIISGANGLAFTVSDGATTASGSSGTPLANAGPSDVLNYQPLFNFSAEKLHPLALFNCVLGDEDQDGDHYRDMFGGIDAIDVQRYPLVTVNNPLAPVNVYQFTFSAHDAFGNAGASTDNAPRGAADGSIFRIAPGGFGGDFVEIVLSEQQILNAIGQSSSLGDDIDVDAYTQDKSGNVYVSFEDDELVNGILAEDGAIVCLPASALNYQTDGLISSVAAGSAVIILGEADVDALVTNSGVSSATSIGDLTALSLDLTGGTYLGNDGNNYPDLLFSGENLGPGIVSSTLGGSVAIVNGLTMGGPTANPADLGLGTFNGVLDSLASYDDNSRALCVDQFDGEVDWLGGETHVEWDIGNATPNSAVLFFVSISSGAIGAQPIGIPVFGKVYPEFFPYPVITNLVWMLPTDANGIASLTGVLTHSISPHVLTSQAWDPFSNQLGQPAAMWFP